MRPKTNQESDAQAQRASGRASAASLAGSFPSQRVRALEQTGRALAIAVPVVTVALVAGQASAAHSLVSAIVLGLVWYSCVTLGFTASRTTLASLGPYVAVARGTVVGLVVTTALGVWLPWLSFGAKPTVAVSVAILALVSAWETVVWRWLTARSRLLIVGPLEACRNVIQELAEPSNRRFQLVGIVDHESSGWGKSLVVGPASELPQIVKNLRPDLVVLAPGCNRPEAFAQLMDAASEGFRVLELAQLYEYAFGRVPVLDLTQAWFMSVLHLYQRPYSRFVKRLSDVLGAALLLLVTAPLFPVLVLAVRSSRGPVFLRQTRVGEHGQLFTMHKFRTMQANAEAPGQAVWAAKDDPRITRAGRIMRRFRLDELPQIWNVVKGDMSLVGPRPERPELVDELVESIPLWTRRHLVKPGITGWAQVNHGYARDADGSLSKLSYDLWYIRHRSPTVDLVICARTLAAVVRGDRVRQTDPAQAPELDPVLTLLRGVSDSPPIHVERA